MSLYNIKEVIEKMKQIANIDSNVQLAKIFNVSYNTLNTWIKREKFPQEILIEFVKKYNCSLDYLVLNKKTPIDTSSSTEPESNIFQYFGFSVLSFNNSFVIKR